MTQGNQQHLFCEQGWQLHKEMSNKNSKQQLQKKKGQVSALQNYMKIQATFNIKAETKYNFNIVLIK